MTASPTTSPLYPSSDIPRPSNRPRNDFEADLTESFLASSPQIQTSTMNLMCLVMQNDLLQSQNMEIFKTVIGLQDELKAKHTEVTGMIQNIIKAIEYISKPSSNIDNVSLPLPAESQDDHPDIKFWTQKQYQLAKKNQRKSTSIQDF
ncbi:hypothetical protein H0H92_016144 [Tricholoma furcatifolium]|nr:hypothetical protein H0H92_016144 [Tricholoma furcatifolium]